MEIEEIFNCFLKNPRSLEYLHSKLARGKELFDAKTMLKDHILHKLKFLKDTVKDSFYELYLKEYRIKEEQRKVEQLQYATNTD